MVYASEVLGWLRDRSARRSQPQREREGWGGVGGREGEVYNILDLQKWSSTVSMIEQIIMNCLKSLLWDLIWWGGGGGGEEKKKEEEEEEETHYPPYFLKLLNMSASV